MRDLRVRLIERICRLREKYLPEVDAFLNGVEQPIDNPGIDNSIAELAESNLTTHKDWPHAPVHRISEHGTYIVTAATLNKEHFFRGEERLTFLENELLRLAKQYDVRLEAWAIFSNQYHFVAHITSGANSLATLISHLHTSTAAEVNRLDDKSGREVWFNFWDSRLTFEKSYFARLNYVHQNAVKHGLVKKASQYRWCSAAWFERCATKAQVETIYSFRIDRVNVDDEYEPVL